MTKLTDTQAVLLTAAAQRADSSVLPLPTSLKPGGGAAKALAALLSRGLAEERATTDAGATHREQDGERLGLFVTAAGLAAIGVEPQDESEEVTPAAPAQPALAPKVRKSALVLDLLRRPAGATMPELIGATGWLPHTTRAALTGLRKQGHAVQRGKRDGATCYTLAGVAR